MVRGLGIIGFIFWLYALWHCASNPLLEKREKIIWFIAIALFPLLGGIVYWVWQYLR